MTALTALSAFVDQQFGRLSGFQALLWLMYLVAALTLPAYHVRPILKYLRGRGGIGDACIRTETIQCLWRLPALLFSMFVVPSLPLFLSIFLDMAGRIGRVLAMRVSQRRWLAWRAAQGQAGADARVVAFPAPRPPRARHDPTRFPAQSA